MLKTILSYFLLAVALILLFFLFQSNRELAKLRLLDNRRMQEVVEAKQAEIDTAVGRIQVLKAKVGKDSVEFKVAQNAAKREIEAYKKTIIRLRPLVQVKIDSFPDLREFVAAQDSTIERQDSLLRDTELFCQLQVNDLQAIIQLQNEKYVAQEAISAAWMETAAEAQKQARKEKRGKKFWQWTTGIAVSVALFLAVQP